MMRNILSFICLLFAAQLMAQSPFTVSSTEVTTDSEMKDDVEAHIGIANATDSTINVIWEREEVTLPAGWGSAICDPNRCWAPTVDTKPFLIESGARNIQVIAHVYPELNTPGTAVIRVTLYEDDDPSVNTVVEYTFNVGLTTGLTEIEERSVQLFPNPSQGAFALDVNLSTAKPVRLRLVNAVGQTVYARDYGQLAGQQRLSYEGAELVNGMYYVMLDVEESTSAFKLSVVK